MNREKRVFDYINGLFSKEKAERKKEKIYACLILGCSFATIFVPDQTWKAIAFGILIGIIILPFLLK